MAWPSGGNPTTHQDVQDAVDLLRLQRLVSGQGYYYMTASQTSQSTGTLTNNQMRLYPWLVSMPVTLSAIGAETTAAGDVGSVLRLGLYSHSPTTGMPNALLYDWGTVPTDVVGSPDAAISTTLAAGLYWLAEAPQGAATTAATLRLTSTTAFQPPIPIPSTSNGSASTRAGLVHSGTVSGALPAAFTFGGTTTALARLYVKVA